MHVALLRRLSRVGGRLDASRRRVQGRRAASTGRRLSCRAKPRRGTSCHVTPMQPTQVPHCAGSLATITVGPVRRSKRCGLRPGQPKALAGVQRPGRHIAGFGRLRPEAARGRPPRRRATRACHVLVRLPSTVRTWRSEVGTPTLRPAGGCASAEARASAWQAGWAQPAASFRRLQRRRARLVLRTRTAPAAWGVLTSSQSNAAQTAV